MSIAATDVLRFALDAIAPAPWKNGGGTTREIAAWPPGAGMDGFAWRISVADIVADGPFSAFPGIDRQIALLEGDGVRLRGVDGTFDHRLDRVGVPFAFAGETPVDATLIGGATRDFNVMTRRDRCRARVDAVSTAFALPADAHAALLLVVDGEWRATHAGETHVLCKGEGMRFHALKQDLSAAPVSIEPSSQAGLCLAVTLTLHPESAS